MQNRIRESIEHQLKELHQQLTVQTNDVLKNSSGEQQVQDFLDNFDAKYINMLQTIQNPLFSIGAYSNWEVGRNCCIDC